MKKCIAFIVILLQLLMLFSCNKEDFEHVDPGAAQRGYGYAVQYIRTDGGYEHEEESVLHIIRSKSELDAYYENKKDIYQLDHAEDVSFVEACKKYDMKYFEQQILLMVIAEEPSGSNRHRVQNITEVYGKTTVEIDRLLPECGTDDMATWHILIEPEAGFDADEEDITVMLDGKNITEKTVLAEHSEGYANISLVIPQGWEYEIDAHKEHGRLFSILFFPTGKTGGVRVCYEETTFGICGTGLSVETINVGRYSATKGTYYDNKIWNYIAINDIPGRYVIYCEGVDDWWKEYGQKAMEILDSLQVAEGCLAEWRALPVAKKICTIEYDEVYSAFDYKTGDWNFTFRKNGSETAQVVTVPPDGTTAVINAS